jgi:hypothetical protein
MKRMIHIVDETAGKLYLATRFLSFLYSAQTAFLPRISLELLQRYGSFWKLFPNFVIAAGAELETGHPITIRFIENMDRSFPACADRELLFPIFSQEAFDSFMKAGGADSLAFCKNLVPPDPVPFLPGWVCGEYDSACFILQRMITEPDLTGVRILISAGATAEDIDPVRYLTNRSTGKMGRALAHAAFIRGAEVTLVAAETAMAAPVCIHTIRVRSAADMAEAIIHRFSENDVYIAAAAVADYTPPTVAADKIKKQPGELTLQLKRTTDILSAIRKLKTRQLIVGFSVETQNELENSRKKLERKGLDFIVINNPAQPGAGFAADTNIVTILADDGRIENLPLLSKFDVGNRILDRIIRKIKHRI